MRSLFIISLPRTFSTETYQIASRALNLRQPSWVMDGEVLNVDRYWHYHGIRFDESAKFTTPERAPALVAQLYEFLDQVTVTEGYIYKDVTQPFVMAGWGGLPRFHVLKIQRDLTSVAYSMLRRGWFSPRSAGTTVATIPHLLGWSRILTPFRYSSYVHRLFQPHFEQSVLEGLVRAERVLASVSGLAITYEDVICDENVLRDALQQLNPTVEIPPLSYINPAFIAQRERLARRKSTSEYKRLQTKIEHIRRNLTS